MFASASVRVRYGIGSSFGGFGGVEFGSATRTNGGLTASGAFASGDLSVTGSTIPWMARAGETITFALNLEVGAAAGCGVFGCPEGSEAFASSGFLDTVGFPTSGPVANLPAGWSISSASGLIVDNRFVGGSAAEIPEPGTAALLVVGLLAGVGLRESLQKSSNTPVAR